MDGALGDAFPLPSSFFLVQSIVDTLEMIGKPRPEISPIPFVNGETVGHGRIAASADGLQICDAVGTALAFWSVVPDVKVEHCDFIFTPSDGTLGFEHFSAMRQPTLFPDCSAHYFFVNMIRYRMI